MVSQEPLKRPLVTAGALHWVQKNLFNSWINSVLTVLGLWLVYAAVRGAVVFVLGASWDVIPANLTLFMVGTYPRESVWRVWACLYVLSVMLGLSAGLWPGLVRRIVVSVGLGTVALVLMPFSGSTRLVLLGLLGTGAAGFGLGHWQGARLQRVAIVAWLLSFPLVVLLLGGVGSSWLPLINTRQWGGMLLTFLLAIVGIVVSLPMGVLLALGRRSNFPAIRLFCVFYIEVIRGVPLITLLFMSRIILPLFLPDFHISEVIRAMVGITMFSAAYMAENVRGGLQAIPNGQAEAAYVLGLSPWQSMLLVVLPQALRAVIPAIVGQFIALFKDTSLVSIIGLLDFLNIGQSVVANPDWLGLWTEVLAFVAVVYWVFTFSMSRISQRIEVMLGVGDR